MNLQKINELLKNKNSRFYMKIYNGYRDIDKKIHLGLNQITVIYKNKKREKKDGK